MSYHVFLSYSRQNITIMQRVAQDLRAAGLLVWTDQGIEPGTSSWQRAIESAIFDSSCMVCILTPESAQSEWVREELNFARTQSKPIYLLLAKGDQTNAVPFGFSRAQWADIRDTVNYRNTMLRLIKTIRQRFMAAERITATPTLMQTSVLHPVAPSVEAVLPEPFGWAEVSGGETNIEDMQHRVPQFYMARYPITNAQFQVFVDADGGYRQDRWWDYSAAARNWRMDHSRAITPAYPGEDLPRTLVSWYEAMAFCFWLQSILQDELPEGAIISLPTEIQWQRAAQGSSSRDYPWGNFFDKTRCNTLKSDIGEPTTVTQYPTGVSPFGIYDMVGNVGEWCVNIWGRFDHDIDGDQPRALRGGGWDVSRTMARIISRDYAEAERQLFSVGFRICLNLPE